MDCQERNPKSSYRWLMAIPVLIVINVFMAPLGFWIDTLIFKPNDEYLGHGIPLFSVLMPLFGAVVTFCVIMTAIICTVVSLFRAGRNQHAARQKNKSKSPYMWLWAIPIQFANNILLIPLGYLAEYLLWRSVSSNSAAYEGIGYPPVFTVLIPAMGVVVTVLVTIAAAVCTVVSLIRARQRNTLI